MEMDIQSMATIDSVQPETDSTDAIEILWSTLKNLTQKLARGAALNAPSEELKALQDEATRIKNCILFLNEAQAVCINPSSIANSHLSTPGLIYQQHASRLNHLIPANFPVRRSLTWLEVRKLIIKTYTAQDAAQELDHMNQLLSLKITSVESVEAFIDRFQRIRCAAKWEYDARTATIFKRALPGFLRQEVSSSLLHLGPVMAYMILSSNICQNKSSTSRSAPSFVVPANNRSTTGSNVRPLSTESSRHILKNAHRSSILGVFKASSTKNKFQCAAHGLANHPQKSFMGSGSSTALTILPSGHLSPSMAIRSARLTHASASLSVTPTSTSNARAPVTTVDINQSTGSNSMMVIDDDSFPVNYDCKKDVSNNTNLSLIVPTTIEHINTMALVDSGSSKRFDTTNNPLNALYRDNSYNLIHKPHTFEALPLSLEIDVIGLPTLPDLSCALVPEYDFISFLKGHSILSYFLFEFYHYEPLLY
ncbi:hypothetical protein BCV72DRAFT_251481 [Rhizopus microsporus var. microsporus]|uniref:Retrotransposon gag domain-containing protein n=1 Tax=Rhizopus microsporus var. microsporus TaxID=86635 RepID=A0A1X0QWC6_RHIZD|nr:hypothetical protein BCV72DRAFT_251481 [Rhizopus microsporus var. microsporus]